MTFLGHCSAPAPGQGSGPYLSFSFCPGKISRSCMCPFYFPLSPFSVSNTASINLICWSAKVSLILPSETRLANTRRRYVISRSTHLICASREISAWGNRSVGMSSVTVFIDHGRCTPSRLRQLLACLRSCCGPRWFCLSVTGEHGLGACASWDWHGCLPGAALIQMAGLP
jgi:hypothetical protein